MDICLFEISGWDSAVGCVNSMVWGWPMIILLLLTGLVLSVGLRFYTLMNIPYAFSLLREKGDGEGDITPFQALTTALSATIGNGNIVGVAAAILIGGPGAVFWMWIMALVGMATKYGEAVLAVTYRETDSSGRFQGGPMYYIKNGLGKNWFWLGWLFAFFAMIAAFGIGNMFQADAVANAVASSILNIDPETNAASYQQAMLIVGFVLAGLTAAVIIGGVKRIGAVAQYLMPFMATIYVIGGLVVIFLNIGNVPAAFGLIFSHAFSLESTGGGIMGYAIIMAMRHGFARGIFSNEAGLGSAAIAHAAAQTNDPVRQGTIAMLGTFIDTIIVCSITAIAILSVYLPVVNAAGVTEMVPAYMAGFDKAVLTAQAFGATIPGGQYIVALGTVLFAYSTLLGWSYYGERSAEFIFGERVIIPYRLLWVVVIVIGAAGLNTGQIIDFSDTMNGLMAIPNLIALLALSGVIFAATKEAQAKRKAK